MNVNISELHVGMVRTTLAHDFQFISSTLFLMPRTVAVEETFILGLHGSYKDLLDLV